MIKEVSTPQGSQVRYEDNVLSMSLNDRRVSKKLRSALVEISIQGNKVVFETPMENRKHKRVLNTFVSHAKNLSTGVEKDYVYVLKVVNSHFPMEAVLQGDTIVIKNFLGERKARVADIMPQTKVSINKDVITVTSPNKEFAGQTAANLERATKIKNRDRRRFQDGIFITIKAGKKI